MISKSILPSLCSLPAVTFALATTMASPAFGFETVFRNGFDFAPNHGSPLGTNLDGVVDYSTSYNFVDVMKQSRSWITQDTNGAGVFDTGEEACLDLDAHGHLNSLAPVTARPGCQSTSYNAVATLFFFGDQAGHYPGGRYIVTWDGSASISYHFAAQRNVALSAPGRDVLDVTAANGGWMMRFDAVDAGNPPRNIHVWMPGYDENTGPSQLFHPDFLSLIRRFKVLRFMDWMDTNNSDQAAFADRPQLNDVRWTDGVGVPLEMMVELANRSDADPWFNMPHQASDDYISQFAQTAHRLLQRNHRVYVEYSNEVWNGQFQQGSWIEDMGTAAYGNVGSGFDRRLNWHGQRTAQMCDLWKTAWGADAARVTCVLGAQAANAYTQTEAADCPLWTAGAPCSGHGIDAVAIAPYFAGYLDGPDTETTVAGWTLSTLFAEINSGGQVTGGPGGGALAEVRGWIDDHHAAATARNLHLVSYEGGQHLVGVFGVENNAAIETLFTSANRDARMGTAYATHLADWRAHGGELFMHFSASGDYGKFGSWGAVEYLDQQNTPKQQALLGFINANPCWWTGCSN
ncbi:MAG: hypothetical protein IT467_06840 [Dokdonella sp.]|nr:hypothetical protein [Dokdonella sp.]